MPETTTVKPTQLQVEPIVNDVLGAIDREREREIISRRYGLFDRKETLEQIGELLGITRERVRQLEKSVMTKLQAMADKDELPHVDELDEVFTTQLAESGKVAKISDLSAKLTDKNTKIDQSRVAFLARLTPSITFVVENDHFHNAAALASEFSEKGVRDKVTDVVNAIKKIGKPVTIKEVAGAMASTDPQETAALASVSKNLATLNGRWGLIKWPMVNPKNIRDKIYVILYENGKQMHFNEIAEAISGSDFKRKDVTTQAIHNELIKDKRFILVGRGIYALKEWGFKQGTVSDVIEEVLKEAGKPLHRDEIVKRVLKKRFVKETTILLNLQGKPQFVRTAKATYTLAEEPKK
jgi:DNA-binding CsgD family transcriptional regulator